MNDRRNLSGWSAYLGRCVLILISVVGVGDVLNLPLYFGVVYHRTQFLAIIFGLIALYVFTHYPPLQRLNKQNFVPWYDWIWAAGGIASNTYVLITFADITTLMEFNTPDRLLFGAIGLAVVIEMVRRTAGLVLVFVATVFILYSVYSNFFPDLLYARPTTWPRAITYLYFDPSGLYGAPMGIMAGVVLAFVLFGNLLFASGGGQFLTDISMRLMGRYRGGPAKISVVSSSLFGTMTGSAAANVAFTGMVTIPMMKSVGYRPAFAGAVEAVASSGGLLAPPVMGAAAFLMADFIDIPYSQVAMAALCPAILYYVSIFIQVHLIAQRESLPSLDQSKLPVIRDLLHGSLIFFIPLTVLIYTLFYRLLPPDSGVMYSIAALLVALLFLRWRVLQPKNLIGLLEKTGSALVEPIVIAGLAGLVLGVVNLTGLGSTLSQALILMAGNELWILLIFTAIASIILGMGMPAVAIYILLAVLVAPALEEFGIPPIAAHLFIYYFGIMSYVTPPMAFACFVSGPMAGADPFRTGVEGMKLSVVAYIVPFLFVFYPEFLLKGEWSTILLTVSTGIVGAGCIAAVVAGFLIRPLNILERVILVTGAILALISEDYSDIAGIIIIVLLYLWLRWSRKEKTANE